MIEVFIYQRMAKMTPKQSKVLSFVSLFLGMFGFLFVLCISQGIQMPFEEPKIREGVTSIIPVIPPDAPLNIDTDQELAVAKSSKFQCTQFMCETPSTPSTEVKHAGAGAGAARRRPRTVPRERESGRMGGKSLSVPGGAQWATDEALRYDPMNGKL